MSNNRTGTFIGGMLIGGAVGVVAGLLLAPRSGRETRKILKKSVRSMPELADDLSSNVQYQADRLSESALRNWEDTLTRLRDAIAAGIAASQAVNQAVEAQDTPTVETESEPIASAVSDRST
ncbi:MAG: YtxH domain-containing protein [Cyanobacteria bacterium SID2]|nr:YtxH domain-containing protein [Cyanobacteria bacterium SID2]MBP0006113.1 YtxH domain-containing protein [Cyanobacteria bacterium SBC]